MNTEIAGYIDLTGVEPTQWVETRKRVQVLRDWCAKARHSEQERADAAAKMGVSVGHFARLVMVWRAHGDPKQISGANRRRGAAANSNGLSGETRSRIDAAIKTLGAHASYTQIRQEAARRCQAAGVPEASEGMVHYMVMRARRDAPSQQHSTGRVLVGQVHVLLPLESPDGGVRIPKLLLAVEEGTRRIIGHNLVTPDEQAEQVTSLLKEITAPRSPAHRPTIVLARNLPAPQRVAVVRKGGARLLSPTMGSHLDTLPLRHQRARPGETRKAPGKAVSEADALLAIHFAVAAHNARLGS